MVRDLRQCLPVGLGFRVWLQVHGFPKVMGVLTHLDAFKDQKKLKKTKKALKHRFWAEIYQGRTHSPASLALHTLRWTPARVMQLTLHWNFV